jgi:predicted Zn-dependent protease
VPRDRGLSPLRWLAVVAGVAAVVLLAAWAARENRGGLQHIDQRVREGKIAEAAQLLRAHADDNPDDPEARVRLAAILREAGRRQDALREIRAGLIARDGDAALNAELGHLLLDSGRPAEAARAFRRALDASPEDERAWVGLLRAMREAGMTAQAEQARERAPAAVRELVPRTIPDLPVPPAAAAPVPAAP